MTERGPQETRGLVRAQVARVDVERDAASEAVISEIEADIAGAGDPGVETIVVSGPGEFAELLLRLCYPSAPEAWVKSEAEAVLAEVGEKVTAKGANFEHWVGLSEEELAIERAAYLSSLEYYAG
jgi:hypothetical protein